MEAGQSSIPAATIAEPGSAADEAPVRAQGGLRVLLAERRASAHSELSRRLGRLGHEVLARVTSGQAALDYAGLLRPDVVLVAPVLEDTAGVLTALNVTRELPGIAAVVLTCHPAAADPAARPNWGAVALVPADAEPADLDAELRGAVARARALVESDGHADGVASVSARVETDAAVAEANAASDEAAQAVADETPSDFVVTHEITSEPAPAGDGRAEYEAEATVAAEVEVAVDASSEVAVAAIVEAEAEVDAAEVVSGDSHVGHVEAVLSTRPSSAVYLLDDAAAPDYAAERDIIGAATDVLVERTGLPREDVLRLMEQEAVDLNQTIEAVARAVLGEDVTAPVSGQVSAAA